MADQKLQIVIDAENKANKAFNDVNSQLDKTSNTSKKLGASVKAVALGFVAFGAVAVKIGKDAVEAFMAQEKAEKRLETIAKQVTGANDEQIKSFKNLAIEMQKVGVIGDEVLIAGQSQIASFTKNADVVTELTDDLADLAVAQYGANVTQEQSIQTANLLGKALSGQLGALTRTGILVNDEFKTAFENANTELERAAVISQIVQDNYGGLNTTMRDTAEGALVALKNNLGDLYEMLGAYIIPAFNKVVVALNSLILWFQNSGSAVSEIMGRFREFMIVLNEKTGLIDDLRWAWAMVYQTIQEDIVPAFMNFWEALQPFMPLLKEFAKIVGVIIVVALKTFIYVATTAFQILGSILNVFSKITVAISDFMGPKIEWLTGVISTLVDKLKEAWQWLKKVGDKMSIGGIVSNVASSVRSYTSGGDTPMAEGGIVTRPTRILAGEAGAEAIVPLKNSGLFGGITVNISGNTLLDEFSAEKIGDYLMGSLRQEIRI